jgi:hypothetical protein
MHVRDQLPVDLEVDTCPERDVILRWVPSAADHLTSSQLSVEVSAEQALAYAEEIIQTARYVIVRSVMNS